MSDSELAEIIDECFADPHSTVALGRLDELIRPLLMAVLVAMEPSLAEDAYQSAFVKFILIFRAGKREGVDYVAYLVAVAKNCLVDEIRRRLRQVPLRELLSAEDSPEPPSLERVEDRVMLFQALGQLDARCRYMIERHYIGDFPVAAVADALGIRVETAYVVLQRCREELRRIMGSQADPPIW